MAAIDLLFTFLAALDSVAVELPWAVELFTSLGLLLVVFTLGLCLGLCLSLFFGLIRMLWALFGPMTQGFFLLCANYWVFAVVLPAWLPPPYLPYLYWYYN